MSNTRIRDQLSPTASICSNITDCSASIESIDSFQSASSHPSRQSQTPSRAPSQASHSLEDFRKEILWKLSKYTGEETGFMESDEKAKWWIELAKPGVNGELKHEASANLERHRWVRLFSDVVQELWDESVRSKQAFILTPFQPIMDLFNEMFVFSGLIKPEIGLTSLLLYAKSEIPVLMKEMKIDNPPHTEKSYKIQTPLQEKKIECTLQKIQPKQKARSYLTQFTNILSSA